MINSVTVLQYRHDARVQLTNNRVKKIEFHLFLFLIQYLLAVTVPRQNLPYTVVQWTPTTESQTVVPSGTIVHVSRQKKNASMLQSVAEGQADDFDRHAQHIYSVCSVIAWLVLNACLQAIGGRQRLWNTVCTRVIAHECGPYGPCGSRSVRFRKRLNDGTHSEE